MLLPEQILRRGSWTQPLLPLRSRTQHRDNSQKAPFVLFFQIQPPRFVPALPSQYPAVAASIPPFFHLLLWSPEAVLCPNPTQLVALDVTQIRHSPSLQMALLKPTGAPPHFTATCTVADSHNCFKGFFRDLSGQSRILMLCHNDVARSRSRQEAPKQECTLRLSGEFQYLS